MKILLIANYEKNVGGISVQVEILYKNLLKDGVQTDIYSLKANQLKRIWLFLKLFFVACRYDVLHIHACSYWGFLPVIFGVIVAKVLRKKIILTYHGGGADEFFGKHTSLVKFFLSKTDYNVVLSGFLENIFKKHDIQCVVIPNIIEFDVDYFKEREVIRPIFISVRALDPIYNISCIIEAFAIVKKERIDAQLYILSDGPCRAELEYLVKCKQLQDVFFIGQVTNKEIYDYLNRADVFVSSPKIDNFPVSVLEAFNAGLLVISSNVGGVPYIVEDNKLGLLFESDNYKELADKMLFAINNEDAVKLMIKNGKESVNKYKWDSIKTELFKLYS